ncbi:hypothetical protein TD95_000640 [Thielaviopsis punctulata]|uniref:Uncharacterized protein n=1 Tax=Thielaviopsis punctulata TaxID=72032 RepID=A0A0F4ZK08_9PEZI|nr:hypothetical protein TD95_000640 [Thielaviopsis punctulata]
MAGPGVGFQYPPLPVSWNKRDLLLFANSIGCNADELHFLYERHPKFSAFPSYPVVLGFKGDTPDVVDFYARQKAVNIPDVPVFDPTRVVDGQRKMTFFKPIPLSSASGKFETRTSVLGVYDKGSAGSVVETQQDLVDAATGTVYTRCIASLFYVGGGNWDGPRGPSAETIPPPAGRENCPDFELVQTSTKESGLLYRLNGDYNPLHATPEPGRAMGFKGDIMHGLFAWNTTCHLLLKKLGKSQPENLREFQARFASPVMPGDTLRTKAWRTGTIVDGFEEIRFTTEVVGGKVCLSNGRALIKVVPEVTAKL